ncbi:bifunctional diguanylate cyclase/phosphodiesterase [Variovorax sp. HJSM1_2]|uniref:bifunctional diguanylate cyclase/phosphodiesterase n=1 Tax=Variovorax sp. HJSM1_2 TaxID=3366263 RepID=UPI003BD1B158
MKPEARHRLEAPIDLAKAQHSAVALAVLAIIAAYLVLHLPDMELARHDVVAMAHLLLELAAVALAIHVIFMAWSGLSHGTSVAANALIFCFGVVAGGDLLHSLTHEAIQEPLLESSGEAGTWFWLSGRAFQLVVMLLLLLRVNLPGPRAVWLEAAILSICAVAFWGRDIAALISSASVADELTMLFTFASWLVAVGLFSRFKQTQELSELWLALGCFLSGLSSYVYSLHGVPLVRQELLSDFIRLASYACVHRAIFLNGFQGPLRRLVHSERALRERESELKNILENLPVGLCRLNENLQIRYVNGNFRHNMGMDERDIAGEFFDAVVPAPHAAALEAHLQRALRGEKIDFDWCSEVDTTKPTLHRHVVLAPARQDDGAIRGVLAIVSDVSDRENALRQAAESTQETLELKAALDAHAIVAVTNAKGVITRVNDKFCSISQYPRHELIGKTHKVINSGYHPKGFFAEMWKVISRGDVWNGEVCNKAKDGSLYWVHTTIVPLLGPDGKPMQYIAIRADITQRKEAEAEAQRMALHDFLTGLPNRRLMGDRLTHALATAQRERHYGALLVLDMDNFKDVNDTLGHGAGDQLLRQIATRISECVRKNDTVARLGGDEFVVILEKLGTTQSDATVKALDIGGKIREELCKPFQYTSHVINTSPSIGVVLFSENDDHPDELVKQADMALYKAKAEGRNRLAFFDPQLQSEINARAVLLRELRNAIPRGELRLFYQPVVDASMQIIGVEALIRWQQDRLGLVAPGEFIPLAEQSNLIIPIGEWVLMEACKQLKAWETDEVRKNWTVAVNVSAKQFHEEEFVIRVQRILRVSGAPASKLRIEITESMMHVNLGQTIVKMQMLKTLGVLFSLDDFGTGYSSLSYLKSLPLDQLKIDRSFVADVLIDENDAAIVRTVIALAEHLGLNVVAEGVETIEQMQLLVIYGCKAFQGYLLGRPVPEQDLGQQIDCVSAAVKALEKARN